MLGDTPISDIVVAILLTTGGFFLFVAGLGILRLPDVLIRMHASTKAGTLGVGLVFTGLAVYFGRTAEISMSLLTIVFLLVTAPVAAHAIARAAYRMNVKLWDRMHIDEWKGQYSSKGDEGSQTSESGPSPS